jgi:hypothetical protein
VLMHKLRDIIQTNGASTKFLLKALSVLRDIDSVVVKCGIAQVTQCISEMSLAAFSAAMPIWMLCTAVVRSLTLRCMYPPQITEEGACGRRREVLNNGIAHSALLMFSVVVHLT